MENAHDFDRVVLRCPIHQEVTSATAASRNVRGAETRHDLIPRFGTDDAKTVGKFADRLNKRVPICARLPRAKSLSGPLENVGEVDLCGCTETNAPPSLGSLAF